MVLTQIFPTPRGQHSEIWFIITIQIRSSHYPFQQHFSTPLFNAPQHHFQHCFSAPLFNTSTSISNRHRPSSQHTHKHPRPNDSQLKHHVIVYAGFYELEFFFFSQYYIFLLLCMTLPLCVSLLIFVFGFLPICLFVARHCLTTIFFFVL